MCENCLVNNDGKYFACTFGIWLHFKHTFRLVSWLVDRNVCNFLTKLQPSAWHCAFFFFHDFNFFLSHSCSFIALPNPYMAPYTNLNNNWSSMLKALELCANAEEMSTIVFVGSWLFIVYGVGWFGFFGHVYLHVHFTVRELFDFLPFPMES